MTGSRTVTVPRKASGNLGRTGRDWRLGVACEAFLAWPAEFAAASVVVGCDDGSVESGTRSGDATCGAGTNATGGRTSAGAGVWRSPGLIDLTSQAPATMQTATAPMMAHDAGRRRDGIRDSKSHT